MWLFLCYIFVVRWWWLKIYPVLYTCTLFSYFSSAVAEYSYLSLRCLRDFFFSQESCKGCSACLILLICCWCLQFFQVFSSLSSFQTYLSCLHLQKHGGTSHYICNLFSVCSILSLLPIEHMNSFPPCQASVHMYIFAFVAVSQWYLYFRTSFVLCLMGSEECESQRKLACFFFFFSVNNTGLFLLAVLCHSSGHQCLWEKLCSCVLSAFRKKVWICHFLLFEGCSSGLFLARQWY